MTKAPENCNDFDSKSQICKGCDKWGDCAMHNMAQFTPVKEVRRSGKHNPH